MRTSALAIWRSCRRLGVVAAVAGVLLSGGALCAAEQGEGVRIPETAAEHLAMAQRYLEKTATYLQDAETHQQMLEAYKKRLAINPKSPAENPWLKKMRKHCQAYIVAARRLAAEARAFAEYHELRGNELQGP